MRWIFILSLGLQLFVQLDELSAYSSPLSEIVDQTAVLATYTYDQACRKIEENRSGRITRFGYDAQGFLAFEERGNRRIEYAHDALGRLCKKSIDRRLETSWAYDARNNVIAIEQGGLHRFDYDEENRLIATIDPQGNKTAIHYERAPHVLFKIIKDPRGIETVEAYSLQDCLLKKEVAGQVVYDRTAAQQRDSIANKQVKKDCTLEYDDLQRVVGGAGFRRELDPFGNIKREEFATGLWIESDYDDWDRPIERRLPDQSRIVYLYEGPFLRQVSRLSANGEMLYSHTYSQHDAKGNLLREEGCFASTFQYDLSGRRIGQQNPYYREEIEYDAAGNLIRNGPIIYSYDSLSQLVAESGRFTAKYDALYNTRELSGKAMTVNQLNQLEGESFTYDPAGNLLQPGFAYDEMGQLIEAQGESYTYDALGRRLQKGATTFLYIGNEEIGAFENGQPLELKIPGMAAPIAIEIAGKPYAPIVDVQGTIRLLIDWKSGAIFKQNDCDAFGEGLSSEIPYAYAGKRYDATTGLIYFGKRYYLPTLHRWLTPDPIGPFNHSNLYQYLFNNPFAYQIATANLPSRCLSSSGVPSSFFQPSPPS